MRAMTVMPAQKLAAAVEDAPRRTPKQRKAPVQLPRVAALTDKTPWIKNAPARRYKPDGTPVTTRVHASKQQSHTQVFNPTKPGYRTVNHLDDALAIRFANERQQNRLYRFVYRNGELSRVQ